MLMQYAATFAAVKMTIFQILNCDIFLIFAISILMSTTIYVLSKIKETHVYPMLCPVLLHMKVVFKGVEITLVCSIQCI